MVFRRPVGLARVKPLRDALAHPRLAPDLVLPHALFVPTRREILTRR
jgi:hypothetical protein